MSTRTDHARRVIPNDEWSDRDQGSARSRRFQRRQNYDLQLVPKLCLGTPIPEALLRRVPSNSLSQTILAFPLRTLACFRKSCVARRNSADDGMLLLQPGSSRQTYSKQLLHADELPYFVCGDGQTLLRIGGHTLLLENKVMPAGSLPFAKYHDLGNDYLVVERHDWDERLAPQAVRKICDRHFDIGSDGILVRETTSVAGEFELRILNPDGSEAAKSGNGLRIFARYLRDQHAVRDEPFHVTTPGGRVRCQVFDHGRTITVDMGQVRFHSADIPVTGPPREVLREMMDIVGKSLENSAATIGNLHCVLLRESISPDETRRLGPLIETDPRFPNRTNVQFMRVLDRANIRIEIWERGAGYTLASGSSSCASAAVAKRLGLCDSSITVHMPGGSLKIEVDENFAVRMTGPVVHVANGHLSYELFTTEEGVHRGEPPLRSPLQHRTPVE